MSRMLAAIRSEASRRYSRDLAHLRSPQGFHKNLVSKEMRALLVANGSAHINIFRKGLGAIDAPLKMIRAKALILSKVLHQRG